MTSKKAFYVLGRLLIAFVLAGAAFEVTAQSTSFVTRWDTDAYGNVETAGNQIRLPLSSSGTYDFVVSWGDGNKDRITAHDQAEVIHSYALEGSMKLR